MKRDSELQSVGALRAATAQARAVDKVEVWVYLPNTRGPVRCYIAGWSLCPPTGKNDFTTGDEKALRFDNVFNLQVRPVDEPAEPAPPVLDESEPAAVPVVDTTDRGTAGARGKERVPNQEDGP